MTWMSRRKPWGHALLGIGISLMLWGCQMPTPGTPLPPEEARQLLCNRNWIDRLPQNEKEHLNVFRFVPHMGGGVFQDRTLFAGTFELFAFEHSGTQIRFDLLHKKEKKTVPYRIEALDKAKGPLDLRLVLDESPRGPSVYYGIRREGGTTLQELDAALAALATQP